MTDLEKILEIGVSYELKKVVYKAGHYIKIVNVYFPRDVSFPVIKDTFKTEEEACKRILYECEKLAAHFMDIINILNSP